MLHYKGVWNERQRKLDKGEVAVEKSQKRYKQYTTHKKDACDRPSSNYVVLKFFILNLFLCRHLDIISERLFNKFSSLPPVEMKLKFKIKMNFSSKHRLHLLLPI